MIERILPKIAKQEEIFVQYVKFVLWGGVKSVKRHRMSCL